MLSKECALALRAFFHGYKQVDSSMIGLLARTANDFTNPVEADTFTRAFLSCRDSRDAFAAILDVMERELAMESDDIPKTSCPNSFVDAIREGIRQGRPGMVLGEPTIVWLGDYARGYLEGLVAIDPPEAFAQRSQLHAFERWLQNQYDAVAPWDGIIRVYYGACTEGLQKFLYLWDEFRGENDTAVP